jgi:formylmethanofuran:tetrahydromethanopterin formyltransferase
MYAYTVTFLFCDWQHAALAAVSGQVHSITQVEPVLGSSSAAVTCIASAATEYRFTHSIVAASYAARASTSIPNSKHIAPTQQPCAVHACNAL